MFELEGDISSEPIDRDLSQLIDAHELVLFVPDSVTPSEPSTLIEWMIAHQQHGVELSFAHVHGADREPDPRHVVCLDGQFDLKAWTLHVAPSTARLESSADLGHHPFQPCTFFHGTPQPFCAMHFFI